MTSWKIIRVGKLPQRYKHKVCMLLHKCFRAGESKEVRAIGRDQYFDDPYAYLLAIDRRSMIGVVLLYKKTIEHAGKKILLGGIGGVCVKKKMRKKGAASALLEKAMQDLKRKGCDMTYLCADVKNPEMVRLYGKVGFVTLDKPYTYLGKSGKRYTENNGMIAPVKSKAKFNLIRKSKKILDLGASNW